ncbi:MAG: hypothetical protein WCS73_08705 [Lentisphaeria bacterium]
MRNKNLFLPSTGLFLFLLAIGIWSFQYFYHPSLILVANDGYGGCPAICYIPEKRNTGFIILPGSLYSGTLLANSLLQNGEEHLDLLFLPSGTEQIRSAQQILQKVYCSCIYAMPLRHSRKTWKTVLQSAQYQGIYTRTLPDLLPYWKIQCGKTEFNEKYWHYQYHEISFECCQKRSGCLTLIVKQKKQLLLKKSFQRCNRAFVQKITLNKKKPQ